MADDVERKGYPLSHTQRPQQHKAVIKGSLAAQSQGVFTELKHSTLMTAIVPENHNT